MREHDTTVAILQHETRKKKSLLPTVFLRQDRDESTDIEGILILLEGKIIYITVNITMVITPKNLNFEFLNFKVLNFDLLTLEKT